MKNLLPVFVVLALAQGALLAQNINDHKVSFSYTQLPLIKIDDKFSAYEIRYIHNFTAANEDSLAVQQIREQNALNLYTQQLGIYNRQRDSLDRLHLRTLAEWEKKVNAGVTNPDGTPLAQPAPPVYPQPPVMGRTNPVMLHSNFDNAQADKTLALSGYTKGLGGVIITVTIQPIRYQAIVESKKGAGATTKYTYTAPYILPIHVKLESPTQGVLYNETLFENTKNYALKEFASRYEYALYMLDNKQRVHQEIEAAARNEAIVALNNALNDQFGYVLKTRNAEMYSVKSFKNYDYTDITNAYTMATQALQLVKNDRDRSSAKTKLGEAIKAIDAVLEESNLYDEKARINDKITAVLQCNKIELLIWQAEFDKAQGLMNIVLNSGEGKAKRHAKDEEWFYQDQEKRWKANY